MPGESRNSLLRSSSNAETFAMTLQASFSSSNVLLVAAISLAEGKQGESRTADLHRLPEGVTPSVNSVSTWRAVRGER